MKDRLTTLLELQRRVCETVQEDPAAPYDVDKRVELFMGWKTALEAELWEAAAEVSWKPWARSSYFKDDAVFGELRDALQFLIDLMFLATGLSAEDLAARLVDALERKSAVNVHRHETGYDGVTGKCPACKRAYDDEAVGCTQADINVGTNLDWCEVHGSQLDWPKATV